MRFDLKQAVRVAAACLLVTIFAVPQSLMAEAVHVVGPADLQKEVLTASRTRQENLAKVTAFLTSERAATAMKSAKIDARQVTSALPTLSDGELAQLAARADKAKADFAAGTIGDRDLIIIILAVVALILIIVAVR
ncbi:MAG: hypothetical protein JST79_13125 [Acidobacteria bacterium]|jgi:hypothetical protein|nr:hypothetical protein [Acidobacteriota bacterium]